MKLEKLFLSILAAAALFAGCKEGGEDSELPSLTVNPTEITVDKSGGNQAITVKSNRDWTVKADADWLAVNPTYGSASKKDATVTVTALQNTGYDRTGTVTVSTEFDYKTITVTQPGDKGEDTTNKPAGSGTKADPYNAAGVIAYIKTLAADDPTTTDIWVKGIISQVTTTFEASGTYGNATFYISGDGSTTAENQFYCFQTYYLGNKKWTSGNPDVKVGDEVIICGKVVYYKGDTPETVSKGGSYIYSLNGQTEGQGGGDDYQNAEAKTVAQFIAAADGTKYYKLTGKVSSFNATYCSFDLTDETGKIYVYSVDNKSDWSDKIKNGGTVTLAGKYMYYSAKEQHEVVNAMILSFEEGQGGGDDYQNAEAKTVAQFIAAADGTKYYKLTGKVSSFNATYCSFDLTDETGKIYVYSVDNKSDWSDKIKNGGTVTLAGKYMYYSAKEQHEVVNAMILSFEEGQGGGDDASKFASNVTWTNGTNAYDDGVATVNGVSNVKVYKLGTSSKVGTATVVIPKGTKSVSFYGVSWKSKPASVQVLFGETPLYTKELAANEGAANNSPYTITVTDSDHYTMALPETLTEDVTVTVTTTGSNTRVILFGIKAEK